jgi:hypothetical protein
MTREELVKTIVDEITFDELGNILNDINSWDGSFEELRFEPNDEDFFNTYFENRVDEAVRAVCYGEYNYTDEYVRFNAYGNLESFDEWQVENEITSYATEIIERYLELLEEEPKYFDPNDYLDTDLCELIEKYLNGEEEEEEDE